MKVLLAQFTRLIDSLQSPGLRIDASVHAIPKERNISITLGYKRVCRWCMATHNIPQNLQYQALCALYPLVPLFACFLFLLLCSPDQDTVNGIYCIINLVSATYNFLLSFLSERELGSKLGSLSIFAPRHLKMSRYR